jgi:hypothetical protein
MFHGEKIVESVRSACTPGEGELLIRLPVDLKLIELKPHGSKNCLANFWTWRAQSEGQFRESNPCRRRLVSRLAAVAIPLLGGPCCRVAALPSRRARECAVITRCAVTTCGPPIPDPIGSCNHLIPHAYVPRGGGGVRRRAAAAREYTHISNLRWNTCRTQRVACIPLYFATPPAGSPTVAHAMKAPAPLYPRGGGVLSKQ